MKELISLEADDEQCLEDIKCRGLVQADEKYILDMAILKKDRWGGIWKSVKTIDKDSNGFVNMDELEVIFFE